MEKNKVMMIVIIALLVILLGAIVTVGIFTFKLLNSDDEGVPNRVYAKEVATLSVDQIDTIHITDAIATNLARGTDGLDHIIKAEISIGIVNTDKKRSQAVKKSIEDNEVIVRDICIGILRSKTYQEASRPDGKDILSEEILEVLQQEFSTNLIVAVYFSDYVAQ